MIWEEEGRMEYADWIASIRKKYRLSQEEFGKRIYHFEYREKEDEEVSLSYHRNSVGNWENGKNLPLTLESVVSLALVDFCGNCDRLEQADPAKMKKRYAHVSRCLRKYLGRSLYVRNINDALLIAAARGLYGIKDLPEVRAYMNSIIGKVSLTAQERKEYSLERRTTAFENELMLIDTTEEFQAFVRENLKYFRVGSRTVGERAADIFENPENRAKRKLKFKEAIEVYAPNYSVSYSRIFSSDFIVSRRWLLNFCIRMRYTRGEINSILKNAGMLPLSGQKGSMEYFIRGSRNRAVGSVSWYERAAEQEAPELSVRYAEAKELPLKRKLVFLALIACALAGKEEAITAYPVDYLLEYLLLSDEGKDVVRTAEKALVRRRDQAAEKPLEILGIYSDDMCGILEEYCGRMGGKAAKEALEEYVKEFGKYNEFPEKNIGNAEKDSGKVYEQARRLRYFAACSYSVMTGRIYTGKLSEDDQEMLACSLTDGIEEKEEMRPSIRFFSLLWIMFLGGEKPVWDGKGGFYLKSGNGQGKSNVLSVGEVLEDIAATWEIAERICTK